MPSFNQKNLHVGDRVVISGSSVRATGIVTRLLVEDYVQVLWNDVRFLTTHRRHALSFAGSLLPEIRRRA
jgi:hypothetical protein